MDVVFYPKRKSGILTMIGWMVSHPLSPAPPWVPGTASCFRWGCAGGETKSLAETAASALTAGEGLSAFIQVSFGSGCGSFGLGLGGRFRLAGRPGVRPQAAGVARSRPCSHSLKTSNVKPQQQRRNPKTTFVYKCICLLL